MEPMLAGSAPGTPGEPRTVTGGPGGHTPRAGPGLPRRSCRCWRQPDSLRYMLRRLYSDASCADVRAVVTVRSCDAPWHCRDRLPKGMPLMLFAFDYFHGERGQRRLEHSTASTGPSGLHPFILTSQMRLKSSSVLSSEVRAPSNGCRLAGVGLAETAPKIMRYRRGAAIMES